MEVKNLVWEWKRSPYPTWLEELFEQTKKGLCGIGAKTPVMSLKSSLHLCFSDNWLARC